MADTLAPYGSRHVLVAPPEPVLLNRKAIASLVLGIVGVFVPIVPSLLAVVLANDARHTVQNTHRQKGEGVALAGLSLGWVGLGLGTAAFILTGLHFLL